MDKFSWSAVWTEAWTFIIPGPVALVATLLTTVPFALSGKISMTGAKYCLLGAWLISVLAFYGLTPILRQPLILSP